MPKPKRKRTRKPNMAPSCPRCRGTSAELTHVDHQPRFYPQLGHPLVQTERRHVCQTCGGVFGSTQIATKFLELLIRVSSPDLGLAMGEASNHSQEQTHDDSAHDNAGT